MSAILIDTKNMTVLKKHENPEALAYWADILLPGKPYAIRGYEKTDFNVFTEVQIRALYASLRGCAPPEKMDQNTVLGIINDTISGMNNDLTAIDALAEKLGKPLSNPVDEIPANDESAKPAQSAKSYNRPKPGTATGRVWEICDKLMAENGEAPKRTSVVNECVEENIHPSTAGVQYRKWFLTVVGE